MTDGQVTVLGLLLTLLVLEAIREPSVKTFLSNWLKNFTAGVLHLDQIGSEQTKIGH